MIKSLSLSKRNAALMVVDYQERLMAAISGAKRVLARGQLVIDAARVFDLPIVVTEQYPRGLGPTVAALDIAGAELVEKTTFDGCRAEGFGATAVATAETVAVIGCEAHVCVLQTALGLLERGKRVAVVADAVGSRDPEEVERAMTRLARAGAEILSAEMLAFEWAEDAADPRFKAVSSLVKAASTTSRA